MLYLVRHGQTQFNVEQRLQGCCDSPLIPKGIMEAEKLATKLKPVIFDAVYASTLGRAIHTAEILKGDRDLTIISLEGLNEMRFGVWEGTREEDYDPQQRAAKNKFFEEPENYIPPEGGQSFAEMFDQVRECAAYLLEEAKDKNILVVSHGMWVKIFYCILKDQDVSQVWAPPFIGNTALTMVDSSGKEPVFVAEGDMSHLEE